VPRPSQTVEKQRELTPIVAQTFAELGYRRTTTAELAQRCGVRENILYRLWPDKKAMFIAAIDYVYESSLQIWGRLLAESDGDATAAQRLLDYEAAHHGEFGLYRIVFAGLSESDDPDIRAALAAMYRRYHRFIGRLIGEHRGARGARETPNAALAAWAIVGLGTVANIGRELGLFPEPQRRRLLRQVGQALLAQRGD
jgi:AcrR family transcriptional regulator